MKKRELDLNKPEDARTFIRECVQPLIKEMKGAEFTVVHLADGTQKKVEDFSDSEAVQYAFELLPIYQARYPDKVDVRHLQ